MAQGVSFPLYIGIGAKLRTVYTYIILYYIILLLYTSRSVYVVTNPDDGEADGTTVIRI